MSGASPSQTVFSIGYDFHVGNGTSGSDNGNVWGITNYKDTTRNQTFTYDALNRLTSAQNAGTNCAATTVNGGSEYWGNSYGYDAWGNLLAKSVTKCGAENLSVTAGTNNQLQGGYTYDAAGNMTHDATANLNYSYDQENRITGAAGNTYTYDGDGNRVEKSNGSTGTLYWYMAPGIVAESDLTGALKSEYVFFDGERVARRDEIQGSTGVFYYFSDHLKTASVITDAAGNIKAESDYYPWGGELQFIANDSNHYKFTGKERDSESGLDYFGARYYSHGLGRWVTPDWAAKPAAVPYAVLGDPQTLNLYTYVRNIPTSRADADGHCDICTQLLVQWFSNAAVRDGGAGAAAQNTAIGAGKGTGSFVYHAAMSSNPITMAVDHIGGEPKAFQPSNQTQADAKLGTTVTLTVVTAALPGPKGAGVESSAPAAAETLAGRAQEIHGALDPIAQSMRTTAAANVTSADGTASTLVSSSRSTLAPAQRAVLQPGETAVSGSGHAEETILNHAQQNGQMVNTMGVSRPPCPTCAQKLKDANVDVAGPK